MLSVPAHGQWELRTARAVAGPRLVGAAGLSSLPPFWLAFTFLATASLPLGLLALPVAAAGIGALPTVGLVLAVGALNMLTTGCMAEAMVRSPRVRGGAALFGVVVADLLGPEASAFASALVAVRVACNVLAPQVGLALTLAGLTGIPAAAWAALLCLVGATLLFRGTLTFTYGVVILLGMLNVGLFLAVAALGFAHLQPADLGYVHAQALRDIARAPAAQALLGVILMSFIGHVYVGPCAQLVLPRDPSGRALVRGSVAAAAAVTALLCLLVLAIDGAVDPTTLAAESGTAVGALAAVAGPGVGLVGGLLTLSFLGMAWVRNAALLTGLARERLPADQRRGRAVALAPMALVSLAAQWLLLRDSASFTQLVGFAGVIANTLSAGILPVLLFAASRRRGDSGPRRPARILGHPLTLTGLYVAFLAVLVFHGLVVWQGAAPRAAALLVALLSVGITALAMRRGALQSWPPARAAR